MLNFFGGFGCCLLFYPIKVKVLLNVRIYPCAVVPGGSAGESWKSLEVGVLPLQGLSAQGAPAPELPKAEAFPFLCPVLLQKSVLADLLRQSLPRGKENSSPLC